MAFSTSDCHSAARGNPTFLSPEFLHYNALRRRAFADMEEGVAMSDMFEVVERDGQPEESAWPYQQVQPDQATWKPPENHATIYRRKFGEEATSFQRLEELLDRRVVTVVVMAISDSFFMPPETGVIRGAKGERAVNTHAVLAVGRGCEGSERFILIRNSWGSDWGLDGHAWLSADYLSPRLYGVGIAGEEVTGT